MSSLRFTKAPPCPDYIDGVVWELEWKGLLCRTGFDTALTIGYLGEGSARIWDEQRHLYVDPTPKDSMNYLSKLLDKDLMWISRSSLLHSCQNSQPSRPCILQWLEDDVQKFRDYFAVPESVAEYLP